MPTVKKLIIGQFDKVIKRTKCANFWATLYTTVYSELTACNLTLSRWLQHRHKAAFASRNNGHMSHRP